MTHRFFWSLLTCLLLAAPGSADTAQEIEQTIARLRQDIKQTESEIFEKEVEKKDIHSFQLRIWADWIQPWQENERKIGALRAEVEALKRMGAFNQNSQRLNDDMRALLAERARLSGLDGGQVDDCAPPCTTIKTLFAYYDTREQRRVGLVKDLTDLRQTRDRLYRGLETARKDQAASRAARDVALRLQRDKIQAERDRYAAMLKDADTYLLPNLDGGPPRVLIRKDLNVEVTLAIFEAGAAGDFNSPEFRVQIATIVRGILRQSQEMRDRIGDYITLLNDQIAALDQRLDGGATAPGPAGSCPARNPDPTGQALSFRIPPGDDATYVACAYFADPAGGTAPGPIKSRIQFKDGKETGVSAYFTLDGGHHLDHIHNVHAARQSGSKCTYHSASAIREYRLFGDDGTEMVVFCEPDGTVGQCDYITHDGRARRCSADCTDKCADLRHRIGWPGMQ
ncbi:hypothetical protein [Antarctobacter heliothermus]|uniref:Uncharacterized protein n=1 Tax=Antarctobacter heliothermus TaxID=74033 RepID=A0A239EHY0_9RHOB|nr:hypothetical protein [Antarctobacter heliothermus]SNS43494.1 hypothetical protein SAMN04488078_10157 [Antarctobacter heliothermus]